MEDFEVHGVHQLSQDWSTFTFVRLIPTLITPWYRIKVWYPCSISGNDTPVKLVTLLHSEVEKRLASIHFLVPHFCTCLAETIFDALYRSSKFMDYHSLVLQQGIPLSRRCIFYQTSGRSLHELSFGTQQHLQAKAKVVF